MRVKFDQVSFVLALFVLIYPIRGGDTLGFGFTPTVIVLSLLTGIFAVMKRRKYQPVLTDFIVAVYFMLSVLALFNAGFDALSIDYFIKIIALSLFPYAIIRYFGFSTEDGIRFLKIFPFFTIISALSMLIIVGPSNILGYSGFRLGTQALNPVGVGYIFGIAAIISVFALRLNVGNLYITISSISISILILILTASRASILGVAIVLALVSLARKNVTWRTFASVAAVGMVGYFAFASLSEAMLYDRFTRFQDSASVIARYKSWTEATFMFAERPIFGHGLGAFETEYEEYVHNIILGHLANGGLLLSLPLLVILFALLKLGFSYARHSAGQIVFLFAVLGVYSFFVRCFSFSMANTKELFLFLALALCCEQDIKRRRNAFKMSRLADDML